jgi:hypothetical protein
MEALLAFLTVLGGAAITWWCSRLYYKRAANDLVTRLGLLCRGLQEAGLLEWTYDESGKVIGLVLPLKASIIATAKVTASAEVVKGESGG